MPDIKTIRFINSDYLPLFRIADGENISITFGDSGEQCIMKCKYIDEYHMYAGSNIYHICQFAELMESRKAVYEPQIPSVLPEMCYAQHPDIGDVVRIKRGETGYYPTIYSVNNSSKNYREAALLNDGIGVNLRQAAAMMAGSMFSWNAPAADPMNYDVFGEYKKVETLSKEAKARKKKEPEMER